MAFSINGSEPIALPVDPIRCHRCGLPVAAWRVDRDGLTYCTDYCAEHARGDVVAVAVAVACARTVTAQPPKPILAPSLTASSASSAPTKSRCSSPSPDVWPWDAACTGPSTSPATEGIGSGGDRRSSRPRGVLVRRATPAKVTFPLGRWVPGPEHGFPGCEGATANGPADNSAELLGNEAK